jgi:enoyl-CoA hydratase/carnithine racemase
MEYETIEFELNDNGIGILTLNRPEKLNAISFQMEEELHSLLDELMINLDCRVIIFRGKGRAFCSGTDLQDGLNLNVKRVPEGLEKYFHLNTPEPVKKKLYHQWRISQIYVKMRKISQPIICAIQGAAVGGGFGFAMASDIRIGAFDAKFVNGSINLGLSGADVGGSYFLPRLIGLSRAAEVLYTGRELTAKEANEYGLLFKIVENEKLFENAHEIATELLTKSPLGLKMTKHAVNLSLDSPSLETILQLENYGIVLSFSSKDMNEGSAAFMQKRKPKYPLK